MGQSHDVQALKNHGSVSLSSCILTCAMTCTCNVNFVVNKKSKSSNKAENVFQHLTPLYSGGKFMIWNKVISSAGFLFYVDWTCLANCSLLNLYSSEGHQQVPIVNFNGHTKTNNRVDYSHVSNLLNTVMAVVEVKLGRCNMCQIQIILHLKGTLNNLNMLQAIYINIQKLKLQLVGKIPLYIIGLEFAIMMMTGLSSSSQMAFTNNLANLSQNVTRIFELHQIVEEKIK